jgi:hypothetical protein
MALGQIRWKVAKTAVAAILTALALGMARQTLAQLTGEDPSRFPVTLTLMTALYAPMAWASIAMVIASITLLPIMVLTLYRFRRNPSSGLRRTVLASCAAAVRPVLLCIAIVQVGLIASPPDFARHPLLKTAALVMLVNLDFWDQPVCEATDVLSARVGDAHYLTVDKSYKLPTLIPRSCASKT